VCNDADGKTEAIVCNDDEPQKRDPVTAEWVCEDEETPKPCGDGLTPGVERQKLLDNPQDVCQDAEG
jgi:hypothetical protein